MQTRFRTAFILLGVLVVLIIVATLGERSRKQRRNPGKPLYEDFQTEQVERITIEKDTSRVELEKTGDQWVVASEGGYAADESNVDKILEAIPKLHTRDLVSRNPEKQDTFEVSDSLGTDVRIEGAGGAEIAHFIVGKQGPDFMTSYVRPANDTRVLLVPQYLKSVFDVKKPTWRDKTIFEFPQDEVVRVEILPAEGDSLVLVKGDDDAWAIVEPDSFPAAGNMVSTLLRMAATLKCDAFPDSLGALSAIGLDPPEQIFRVSFGDGREEVLKIGATDDRSRHYVMKQGSDTVFLLSKGRVTGLMRSLDHLKAEPEEETS